MNQYLNSHPMRTKEGASGFSNVVCVYRAPLVISPLTRPLYSLCACAVIASYVPMFMLQKAPQTQAA